MKNKGLLMIILLLAFCCVLTGYAMTEGATERLEIDANEVTNILYVCQESQVGTLQMDHREDIDRIVEELQQLKLRPATFKISYEDIETMTFLVLLRDEASGKQPIQIAIFPGKRVLVSEGASYTCYLAYTQSFLGFVGEYVDETAKNYSQFHSGMGVWVAFPDELQE